MTSSLRTCLVIVALAIAASTVAAQIAPDRSKPPAPGAAAPVLKLPALHKHALSNGLPAWIVEQHEVPVAHVSLVFRAGSGSDPVGKFGLARMTADMLDEGAAGRSALEIADAVDFLGADLSTSSSFDASGVDLHVTASRLVDALPVMADVALRPTFPEKELDRLRSERLTDLVQAEDDPATLIRFAFSRLVFGPTHRYGTAASGTAATLKRFTAADVRAFHTEVYRPANAVLIVTGDVAPATVLPILERTFGSWKAPRAAIQGIADAAQLRSRQVFLIDKPGAAQSQVRIGWIGVPRSTADYFAIQVLNTILGGSFTSRLNQNLREKHGYAYGAGSVFDMRSSAGPFFASASVQTDKTAPAITEFFTELQRMLEPVSADELAKAKNYLALGFPQQFETTRDMAAQLAQMFVYDLPEDFFSTYVARVQAVTAADVQRAAHRYIQPDKFAVVIVGDRKAIESDIRALNLGPLRVVTMDEVMK